MEPSNFVEACHVTERANKFTDAVNSALANATRFAPADDFGETWRFWNRAAVGLIARICDGHLLALDAIPGALEKPYGKPLFPKFIK